MLGVVDSAVSSDARKICDPNDGNATWTGSDPTTVRPPASFLNLLTSASIEPAARPIEAASICARKVGSDEGGAAGAAAAESRNAAAKGPGSSATRNAPDSGVTLKRGE